MICWEGREVLERRAGTHVRFLFIACHLDGVCAFTLFLRNSCCRVRLIVGPA
jgi:hypothetical protein